MDEYLKKPSHNRKAGTVQEKSERDDVSGLLVINLCV